MLKALNQPLLHFLLLGALVFLAYELTEDAVEETPLFEADRIVVDRAALLDFMQYRASAFDPDAFAARLDAMNEAEIAALVDDYVREEALYREALGMGMAQGDYIIRQRLVQKVEFLLENLVADDVNPTDAELQIFYQQRQHDYQVDAVYTFTHIFLDAQQGGMDQARARAGAILASSDGITFDQSAEYGDRYPFLQNYVERTRDFVVNNFSAGFVAQLDQLPVQVEGWQGPIESRYGYHLVMLRARSEPFIPALADIRTRVLDDYRYEALMRSRQKAEERVIAGYDVELLLP